MTDYTDVPKANDLHVESQLIAQALANLEAGGTLASMVIAPPPYTYVPPDPAAPPVAPPPTTPAYPVNILVPPPVDAVLLANITQWLEQRMVDIAAELTTLGVTVPPAGDAQWSTGPTYPPGYARTIPPTQMRR